MNRILTLRKKQSKSMIAAQKWKRMFEVEKDAKNAAYYFILSHGYFDEFRIFCGSYTSNNPHRDSIEYIIKNRLT